MSGTTYDAVVVGLGPGGATAAADMARRGLRVLGIEKDAFPRYHIGESLTGTVGDYLREVGLEDEVVPAANELVLTVRPKRYVREAASRDSTSRTTSPARAWLARSCARSIALPLFVA